MNLNNLNYNLKGIFTIGQYPWIITNTGGLVIPVILFGLSYNTYNLLSTQFFGNGFHDFGGRLDVKK